MLDYVFSCESFALKKIEEGRGCTGWSDLSVQLITKEDSSPNS